MSVVLFISLIFFYLAFSNNVWCVFDICSVSTISLVSLDRCLYSLFFLRRKQQLLSLLKGFEHQRQNKLYAFRAFFPFFSPSYWIFIYVTAVCTQIDLEHLFLFFFFYNTYSNTSSSWTWFTKLRNTLSNNFCLYILCVWIATCISRIRKKS